MASPARTRRVATYTDLVAVPAHFIAEIVDGDLHASPRPAAPHTITHSSLGGELIAPYQFGRGGPGGWWILYEPELHLGHDILVPDFAGWRRQRLPEKPSGAFFTLSPDWICEIVSPSTERLDRTLKLPIYAREAVAHAWIVNPLTRTLEVYRLEHGRWSLVVTHGDDALVRVEPFAEIELDLLHLWGEFRQTQEPRP